MPLCLNLPDGVMEKWLRAPLVVLYLISLLTMLGIFIHTQIVFGWFYSNCLSALLVIALPFVVFNWVQLRYVVTMWDHRFTLKVYFVIKLIIVGLVLLFINKGYQEKDWDIQCRLYFASIFEAVAAVILWLVCYDLNLLVTHSADGSALIVRPNSSVTVVVS